MGKIKRGRQKAHIAAVKSSSGKQTNKPEEMDLENEQVAGLTSVKGLSKSDLFKDIEIGKFALTDKLPDFDARSAISSKSLKGLNLNKKDKMKLRREIFLKRMDAVETAKKKAKEKKRKAKTPIVGDIGSLGDALPTLELLMKQPKEPKGDRQINKRRKGIETEKKRKKQVMEDIAVFRKVLKHPAFKKDPAATMSEHLHNKQKLEEQMES